MAKNDTLKLVIDTNLWISFIISKKLHLLETIIVEKKCRLLFSAELIEEISNTIQKPKLKKYFPKDSIIEMMETFEPFNDLVEVNSKIEICRDLKDNFLLNLAVDGKANFLLTGDKDLLDLKNIKKIKIITIAEFFEIYSKLG